MLNDDLLTVLSVVLCGRRGGRGEDRCFGLLSKKVFSDLPMKSNRLCVASTDKIQNIKLLERNFCLTCGKRLTLLIATNRKIFVFAVVNDELLTAYRNKIPLLRPILSDIINVSWLNKIRYFPLQKSKQSIFHRRHF